VTPARRRSTTLRCQVVLVALALLSFSGCRGTPRVASPAAPPRDSLLQLQTNIQALLDGPALERTTWGILVQSVWHGGELFTLGPDRLFIPASALKIVTLATTAERLGWDYRFETRVVAGGPISGGVLHGDLIIVGSGDPSLDDWDGAASQLFQTWAEQLTAAGVTRIAGRIVGDARAFDHERLGAGWAWDDLAASYATGVGALQFNQNTAQLVITPAEGPGGNALVALRPSYAPVRFRGQISTSPATLPVNVTIRRAQQDGALQLGGSVPMGGPAIVRNVSVDNPTEYFVRGLRTALLAQGIAVDGQAAEVEELHDPPPSGGQLLVLHRSAPLAALGITMMKLSQNLYAETLLKTLGTTVSGTGSTALGSTSGGQAIVRDIIQTWGLSPSALQMADGSGLSRHNLVTPRALVEILVHVHRDERLRGPFESTLPVAGVDSTLTHRLQGTPAEGNALVKTGSMLNVRAAAGYVRTADAEPLAFAIIANNYAVPPSVVDTAADGIIAALAAFRR